MKPQRARGPAILFATALLAAAGCRVPASVDVPFDVGTAAAATPGPAVPTLPPAPSLLVVCLGDEPSSLYLYGPLTQEAQTILQAIYDGPFDVLGYTYQPVLLESTPSLANGGAHFEATVVSSGDLYYNPGTLLPDTLSRGKTYPPSGCTGPDCLQTYDGGEVSMDRMVVDFRLRSGVTWSDGTPVTAQDSVFSFRLNADGATSASKDLVYRTATYEAVDEATVRWVGLPGYLDPEIAAHFWSPLPEHILNGIAPADLASSNPGGTMPIGWGPYRIESRVPGQSISLSRNPGYFRSGEGLPVYDEVLFRFVGRDPETVLQQAMTGECDVIDESALTEGAWPLLFERGDQDGIRVAAVPGPRLMRADFLQPASPIFSGSATRLALAQCSNRDQALHDVLGGYGSVPASYLPDNHPQADPSLQPVPFDPAAAASALEVVGWIDDDGSPTTPRVSHGVDGVNDGTLLAWTIGVAPGSLEQEVARLWSLDLARCGAKASLEPIPPEELYAPYPDGRAFGGHVDMVVWSWFTWVTPPCDLFASWEVPSAAFPEGSNASGFSDASYDAACRAVLYSPGAEGGSAGAAALTQQVFRSDLPALPLVVLPRVVVVRASVCGLTLDPSPASLLWNLEAMTPCPG